MNTEPASTLAIEIFTQTDGKRTVNARELHAFLDNGYQFTTWIRDRIEQFEFIEGEDFITMKDPDQHQGRLCDWHLTVEMAKELSMLEKTERGKEARKYFLTCERKLNQMRALIPNFDDPIAAALAWVEEKKKSVELEKQITELIPKAAFVDKMTATTSAITVGDFSKLLYAKDFPVGRNKLYTWLRTNKYIDKRNIPYQVHINNNIFKSVMDFENSTEDKMGLRFLITGKGQIHLEKKLTKALFQK